MVAIGERGLKEAVGDEGPWNFGDETGRGLEGLNVALLLLVLVLVLEAGTGIGPGRVISSWKGGT